MREGAFSKLGSRPWCHVLAALEADRRPVRVAALLDVQRYSSIVRSNAVASSDY